MNVDAHRVKAERIERSLAKCTVRDYETVVEGAMLAGTHWFNVLLHLAGLRAADNDIVHTEFIQLGERRKLALAMPESLRSLDIIEDLRTTHVRGDMPDGEGAARRALECLARLRAACAQGSER
jgi:hypothetical protein